MMIYNPLVYNDHDVSFWPTASNCSNKGFVRISNNGKPFNYISPAQSQSHARIRTIAYDTYVDDTKHT